VVRKKADTDLDWKNFKYMVFDLPNLEATYAERYARLGMLAFPFFCVCDQ